MEPNPAKALRLLVNLTQIQLAELSGVSRTTISNIESGMIDHVPIDVNRTLGRLCREQSVSPKIILGDMGLDDAVREWKRYKREHADLGEWPVMSLAEIVTRYPSRRAFCTALCVLPATLYNVLDRGIQHGQVEHIRSALADAGYRYAEWVK